LAASSASAAAAAAAASAASFARNKSVCNYAMQQSRKQSGVHN
jgi:hypothetical protein